MYVSTMTSLYVSQEAVLYSKTVCAMNDDTKLLKTNKELPCALHYEWLHAFIYYFFTNRPT